MDIRTQQDIIFIPHKNGRIYMTCFEMKNGYYILANQGNVAVMEEGPSKKEAIHQALKRLDKIGRR